MELWHGTPSTSVSTPKNQDARRACHNELFNLRHKAGGDPINFFTKGWDVKLRLEVLGEEVSDEIYQDIMLNGLTAAPEFRFIREMHYRDEFTSVDHLQNTANRYDIDQRSRNAFGACGLGPWGRDGGRVKHRQYHQCKEYGHFKRDCPQQVRKSRPKRGKEKGKGRQGGGGNYQPKWCSEHNTTKHSDAECNKQN